MKILMGSKNPGKIEGAKRAFEYYYPNITIDGIAVESEVGDEPVNEQIYQGCKNRIKNLKQYAKEQKIDTDFYVAIESGVTKLLGEWVCLSVACMEDKNGLKSFATSPGFPIPEKYISDIISTELSEVMNKIFGKDEQRHNQKGAIMLLTKNRVSRIDLTENAFTMALTKYVNEVWR